jgi:pimeloyl-CoA dehydrogenase small subunit
MDFDLSSDQRLLKESVDRFIADKYGFEARAGYLRANGGWEKALWGQYAELGLLGLPFAEEDGGFGGGGVETMIVMESFGRGLVLEPYFASIVLAGGLLGQLGSAEQKAKLLPELIEGKARLAFAHSERQARYTLSDIKTTARQDGGVWRISGEKALVVHGESADLLIVSARVSGGQRDQDGIGLFLVDAGAGGVTARGYVCQDNLPAADFTLENVIGEPLGQPGKAFPAIALVVDKAIAALCAEAVGAMGELLGLTVEYLKTRKQFGRPIGDFQVLQHRAVDMFTALEQAKSMAMFAAVMADSQDATERGKAISAAKAQIGRSARFIGQEAIQLHGGIGMTMEYKAGHLFKRLTMIEKALGDTDYHLNRLADQGGLFSDAA